MNSVGYSATYLSSVLILAFAAAMLSLYFNRFFNGLFDRIASDNQKLHLEIREREKAESQANHLNETLEERVRIRTAELQKTENELQQSERLRAIGQLAGGIAHDFNNQLAGILGCADLLKINVADDPEASELARTIISAARRAADLTRQLLAFSRKGKQQIVPVSLNDMVTEVVQLLQRSINKKIHLNVELKTLDKAALGDPSQFENAILNLALNARDAIDGEGTITIRTSSESLGPERQRKGLFTLAAGSYLRVDIVDTGHGMSQQTMDRIFEPFFTTKPHGQGLGMGLAAVYGTMVNYGGAVEVESSPGSGSCFSLYFPAVQEAVAVDGTGDIGAQRGSGTILIVDDEKVVRQSVAVILQRAGYTVLQAESGPEGVEMYKANISILKAVVLDLVMPDMSGEEVLDHLQTIDRSVPILLSSGYSLDGAVQKILDKGAVAFVPKPYRAVKLVSAVADAIRRAESRH